MPPKNRQTMGDNQPSLRKNEYFFLTSLFTLITFLTLFVFRNLDDNRLTSWQWVFSDIDVTKIFFILILGIILAFVLSKVSFPEHHPVTFLFLSSFVIAAFFWREPEIIVDTSRYFTQAKHLEVYGIGYFFREWGKNIMIWTDLPVVPLLYGLIFRFFGESRVYIQVFTTFLFSMTVVLTYLIGKMLWDEDIGFSAGALLLGIPYLFIQVPLMLVDVPTMFFFTLSIFAFIKALNQGGIRMITLSSIAIFLTFFSKYSTWLMLSVLVVIFLVHLKIAFLIPPHPLNPPSIPPLVRGDTEGSKGGVGGLKPERVLIYRAALITLISGFLIGAIILYKFDVFSEQIKLLLSYQRPGLKRWGESFTSTFLFQIHPFITVAALYSVYAALKKRDLKYAIIIWLMLLVVLLQIKRIRYIIMVFPMLALMASYGLQEIETCRSRVDTRDGESKAIRKFIVSCIIISSIVIAVFAYLPFTQKISAINLKDAGKFLNSLGTENVAVFTLPQKESGVNPAVSVPILDYFTKKRIHYNPPSIIKGEMGGLTDEKIQKSPLRFTWEYKNPEYYTANNKVSKWNITVVVISGGPEEILPNYVEQKIKGYRMSKVFKTSDKLFQYRTIVKVYQPAEDKAF